MTPQILLRNKLYQLWEVMGIGIPKNADDIVEFCYKDIYNKAEFAYIGLQGFDVYRMAFLRWIENQNKID